MLTFKQVLDLPSAKRQDVIRQARLVLLKNSNNLNALMMAAAAFMGERDSNNARQMLEKAHSLKKTDPSILYWLSRFYQDTHDYKKAKIAVAKLCELEKSKSEHWVMRGEIFETAGDHEVAVESYKHAQTLGEKAPVVEAKIGECWRAMGNMEKAREAFESTLLRDPVNSRALGGMANTGKYDLAAANVLVEKIVKALLVEKNKHPTDQSSLRYAAAKVLNDADEIDRAFEFYHQVNKYDSLYIENNYSEEFKNNPDAFIKEFLNNKSAFTPSFVDQRAGFGSNSRQPIFIIGMPRSGTTLVESICAAHSKVTAGDELPFLETLASQLGGQRSDAGTYARNIAGMKNTDVMRFANSYLDYTKDIVGSATHFTDKLPHNFMQVGLIHLLFPNAKIVHCRRNPADNCLSIYTNSMNSAHIFYKSDLERLGRYYVEYLQLMEHWRGVFPGKMHEVFYEDVVANTEINARQIIKYLELPWEEKVLKRQSSQKSVKTLSAWQVRQPVYTSSVGKWRKFEKHLGPLIDALGPVVGEYDRRLVELPSHETA